VLRAAILRRGLPENLYLDNVDINGISDLSYIRVTESGLAIGALTRHSVVESSAVVRRVNPLVVDAVRYIGHLQIRNRGTIGGSLAHNDPSGEYPLIARFLDAEIVLVSANGERVVAARDFLVGYLTTDVRPGELVTEIRMPGLGPRTGWSIIELARRHGDFAIVSVAATVTVDAAGAVTEARLALGGVGGVPHVAAAAGRLVGLRPGPDDLAALGAAVTDEVQPESDASATAGYRRHLADVLSRPTVGLRALRAPAAETCSVNPRRRGWPSRGHRERGASAAHDSAIPHPMLDLL
jgi:CO/xanthine dehydrogenase FAD-binding subunit